LWQEGTKIKEAGRRRERRNKRVKVEKELRQMKKRWGGQENVTGGYKGRPEVKPRGGGLS